MFILHDMKYCQGFFQIIIYNDITLEDGKK